LRDAAAATVRFVALLLINVNGFTSSSVMLPRRAALMTTTVIDNVFYSERAINGARVIYY
jgi:hypothetical protein